MTTLARATTRPDYRQASAATLFEAQASPTIISSASMGADILRHEQDFTLVKAGGEWRRSWSQFAIPKRYDLMLDDLADMPVLSEVAGRAPLHTANDKATTANEGLTLPDEETKVARPGRTWEWMDLALAAFPKMRGMTSEEAAAYRNFKKAVFRRR